MGDDGAIMSRYAYRYNYHMKKQSPRAKKSAADLTSFKSLVMVAIIAVAAAAFLIYQIGDAANDIDQSAAVVSAKVLSLPRTPKLSPGSLNSTKPISPIHSGIVTAPK